jgi:MSHA biogenesis protein MshN
MSVINQMLNELEKRGESGPLQESAIRAVPEKSRGWQYLLAGSMLLGAIAALVWVWYQPAVAPPSLAGVAAQPTHSLASSQVLAASQVAAPAANESARMPLPAPEAQLHSGLAQLPASSSLPAKPLEESAAATQNASALVAKQANARSEPPASLNKQLKQASPQQQAENEFRKANALAQQGLLQEAAMAYATALRLDPEHAMAREALVAVLLQSKRNAEAEQTLQEGLQQNLKQAHFAMLLARLQVERDALSLALGTLEKSLPYAKQQADYQAFVAALLQRQNRHQEAIVYYQAALQMSPNSSLWLMGLGISLQALQRKTDARDAYQRAIETRGLSPELQAFVAQRMQEIK